MLIWAKVLALAEWRSLQTQDWDLCDFSPPAQLSEHQLMKGVNKNQDAEVIRRKKEEMAVKNSKAARIIDEGLYSVSTHRKRPVQSFIEQDGSELDSRTVYIY